MKLLEIGLLCAFLTLLCACSSRPPQAVRTVLLAPPEPLLAPCPETRIPAGGTNADLLEFAKMLRLDLAACNQSKERIKEWLHKEKQTMGKEEPCL